jgi:hypothetical protein
VIIGPRNVPQAQRTTDEVFVSFLSAYLAHMVTADGVLDEREVETAEREAISHLGGGFDAREFREFCRNTDQLAPLAKLTEWSTKFLTPSGLRNAARHAGEDRGRRRRDARAREEDSSRACARSMRS